MTNVRPFPPPPRRSLDHRLRDGQPPAYCQCASCRSERGLDPIGVWSLVTTRSFLAGLLTGACGWLLVEVAVHV